MSLQFAEATFFLFSLEEWQETRNFAYTLTQKEYEETDFNPDAVPAFDSHGTEVWLYELRHGAESHA